MAYTLPRDPGVTESLQCLACAARQVIGNDFNYSDLQQVMVGEHAKQSEIVAHTRIDAEYYRSLDSWAKDPSDPKLLEEWINSCIWVSNALISSSYLVGQYVFCRQDQIPGGGKGKNSFKDIFNVLKKEIKDAIKSNPSFARSYAGRIYKNIEISDDKWDPADIVAVKKSSVNKWKTLLSPQGFLTSRKTMVKTMRQDLSQFARVLGKKGSNKLKIVEAMEDLYEYNKLINNGIDTKEFVPISLKKATSENPQVQHIYVREPKDLEKYFHMTVEITKVRYDADIQKALIDFKISNLAGSADTKYKLDARGFESTAEFADIQIQLMQPGASAAAHGKITLPVTTQQIKMSGGNSAFIAMNNKKRALFNQFSPTMKKKLLKSSIHGFTDYRIFQELSKGSSFFNADMSDVMLWGEYVEWLSGGQTTKKQFVENATGDKFYTKSAREKHKLNISHTQAKYMKNKVQSYEVAWIVDHNGASLRNDIKDNILKSMWMYAASKGFAIFKTPTSTFYLLSGPYLKCAA